MLLLHVYKGQLFAAVNASDHFTRVVGLSEANSKIMPMVMSNEAKHEIHQDCSTWELDLKKDPLAALEFFTPSESSGPITTPSIVCTIETSPGFEIFAPYRVRSNKSGHGSKTCSLCM